jgi:predicted nuclease with TOPRIM domain
MKKTYKHINAACDDIKNEVASLRKEKRQLEEKCSQMLDKQYKDDYKMENLKNRVDYFAKEAAKFEKENKVLREVIRLWV